MQNVKYSIEFSHIYGDESFNDEHLTGVKLARAKVSELNAKSQTYNTCIYIDDYNVLDNTLDIDGIKKIVNEQGVNLDFVFFETQTAKLAEAFLENVSYQERKKYMRYILKFDTVPCSLNIAIWYALRLGFLKDINSTIDIPSYSSELITIIPRRFEQVEDRALQLLKKSEFSDVIEKINYVFFESPVNVNRKLV